MEQLSIYNKRTDVDKWQLSDDVWADVSVDVARNILTLVQLVMVDYIQAKFDVTKLINEDSLLKYGDAWYVITYIHTDELNGFITLTARQWNGTPEIYSGGSPLATNTSEVLTDKFENEIKVQ